MIYARSGREQQNHPLIWVTGAGGLIGSWIMRMAATQAPKSCITALTRQALDLTDFSAVRERFRQERPALLIHCAAISQSPACQANPSLAYKVNVEATAVLAELAAEI